MSSLPLFYDRVLMTSTTTGTGTLTLGSAVAGYQAWSVLGDGNSAFYYIEAVDGNGVPTGDWEVGLGTYASSGTTLARSVLTSSNANALVNFGAGTKRVGLTNPALYVQQTTRRVPELRLTTETGVPVSTTNRTAQATLYATPSTPSGAHLNTGYVRTYTGSRVREQSISADKSLGLAIVSGAVQDIFIKDSDLSLTAEYWKNSTVTFGVGAGTTINWTGHGLSNGDSITLATTGGLPVGLTAGVTYLVLVVDANSFHPTLYDGALITTSGSATGTNTAYVTGVGRGNTTQPRTNALATPTGTDLITSGADNTFLWLGTIQADGTNTTADSAGGVTTQVGGKRFVWNAYNQVERPFSVFDSTNNWSYKTATIRQANGAAGNLVQAVCGLATTVSVHVIEGLSSTTFSATYASAGIGINSSVAYSGIQGCLFNAGSNFNSSVSGVFTGLTSLGACAILWLECGAPAATCTFLGDDGDQFQSGLVASVIA